MVDAIDLSFVQRLMDLLIQPPCGFQIRSEWLFNHDTPPASIFSELPGLCEQVDDLWENTRRRCHIIDTVPGTSLAFLQQLLQFLEICRIVVASLLIKKPGRKILPFLL